ncbi:MAG: hypothetical protein A2097_15515 [Desulfobacula sp. GWF2_41_7]|nr:MAG: hypothetical protein A2097_15515 [Desulfobacula sp. GWF2_41_7]
MSTVKDRMTKVIIDQPDDASYEEIFRELAFDKMIENGLRDSREGRTISNEEMKRRMDAWQK